MMICLSCKNRIAGGNHKYTIGDETEYLREAAQWYDVSVQSEKTNQRMKIIGDVSVEVSSSASKNWWET